MLVRLHRRPVTDRGGHSDPYTESRLLHRITREDTALVFRSEGRDQRMRSSTPFVAVQPMAVPGSLRRTWKSRVPGWKPAGIFTV